MILEELNLDYTYLDSFQVGISQFGAEYLADWAGAYVGVSALPQSRGNLALDWDFGAFNTEVYQGLLGLAPQQLKQLRDQGVI